MLERDEIVRRGAVLFESEGWPLIVHLLRDVDEMAIASLRAHPDNCERPAAVLASNESLRNALRTVSRLIDAQRAGLNLDEPISVESLPEATDIFDV